MADLKKIGMAAGTFGVALGIGFVMQNGDALASRFGADTAAPQPAPFVQEASIAEDEVSGVVMPAAPEAETVADAQSPEIVMPQPVAASAVVLPQAAKITPEAEPPVQLAALDPEIAPTFEDAEPLVEAVDCVPTMAVTAGSAAMVSVDVSAPCYPNAVFTMHHQGMMFTAQTNDEGVATLTVPALAEVAVMIAAFDNGEGAVGTVVVPDFSMYDRAVLQWQGDVAVMLSAYEGDATFGDDDHIYIENPGTMSRLDAAEGGYLMRLGEAVNDDPLMAEVYTFPSGMDGAASDVMIVAEAEITQGNCGQELNAQSIQIFPTGETSALDLTLTMPECDAVGDILILQNMFEDLTLASR